MAIREPMEHPIEEWDRLQEAAAQMPMNYDNLSNLRITRCQLIFTGYDGAQIIFRKSNRGKTSVKLAEFTGKRRMKWFYLWEHMTKEETKRIGEFLLRMSEL